MKFPTSLVVLPLMFALGASAEAACIYTQAPQELPNGGKASKEEMLAAQGEVKQYSKTVQEVYLACLEQDKNDAIAALDSTDPEYATKKANLESIQAKKHNAALDELQALAARWNGEIKAFKDKAAK